jgi:hypothetical protein
VALKIFLDGSGQSEDTSNRFLTLASIVASDNSWPAFETEWSAALKRHDAPYSHMNELLRGDGPFHGWEDGAKRAFVKDLFNVLGRMDREDFVGSTLTIDLTDYRKLAAGKPSAKPAEAVCVDFVMTHAFAHRRFTDGRAEIFFDCDESFIKYLERIWSRNRYNASSWAGYISTVAPVEMRALLPVQAADLLAWSANRFYASEKEDFWRTCLLNTVIALEHYRAFYQEASLLKHPGFFEWRSA